MLGNKNTILPGSVNEVEGRRLVIWLVRMHKELRGRETMGY